MPNTAALALFVILSSSAPSSPASSPFPPFVIPAKAGIQERIDGPIHDILNFMKHPCVYILANKRNGTLYVGVTSDLTRRVWEHKNDAVTGFSQTYQTHLLVYAEFPETMETAITREKQIKKWRRAWKIELIEQDNLQWRDLYHEICV